MAEELKNRSNNNFFTGRKTYRTCTYNIDIMSEVEKI